MYWRDQLFMRSLDCHFLMSIYSKMILWWENKQFVILSMHYSEYPQFELFRNYETIKSTEYCLQNQYWLSNGILCSI